jgi:hypothetical protein
LDTKRITKWDGATSNSEVEIGEVSVGDLLGLDESFAEEAEKGT